MAEYRRQILAGGVVAVLVAISIGVAVIYVPSLHSPNASGTTSLVAIATSTTSPGVTSPRNTTQATTVTITLYNGTKTITVVSYITTTETVTVTEGSSTNSTCPTFNGSGTPSYCAPIFLSNSQPMATPPNLQILLNMDWSNFGSFLAPNVQNVVFADASGIPIYSWCESNCSNTQASSNVWIKDPSPIQPYGRQLVYMYIFPTSVNEYGSTSYWGAYPTFTTTYGQYDNGPEVFDFYNNFNGSSLCSCLTAEPFSGGLYSGGSASYRVSNGLTITATGALSGAGYGYHIYLNTPESYSAVDSNVVGTDVPTSVNLEAAYRYNSMDTTLPNVSYLDNGFYSAYSSEDMLCGCGNSLSIHLDLGSGENGSTVSNGPFVGWTGVGSMVWPSTGSEYVNYDGVQQLRGTDSTLTYGQSYADIAFINGLPSQHYMMFDWMRTRNAPPNNLMPAASFGSLIAYQTSTGGS